MTDRYAQVPHRLSLDASLSARARFVWHLLAAHADREGRCYPSTRRLAELSGWRRAFVIAALRELESRGWITTLHGKGMLNQYQLGGPPAEPLSGPPAEPPTEQWSTIGTASGPPSERVVVHHGNQNKNHRTRTIEQEPPTTAVVGPAERPAAAAKANRVAAVIDALRARGHDVQPLPRDAKAIRESGAAAEEIADAYVAVFDHTWGDQWMRDSLSLHMVIDRLAGYRASQQPRRPKAPSPAQRGNRRDSRDPHDYFGDAAKR